MKAKNLFTSSHNLDFYASEDAYRYFGAEHYGFDRNIVGFKIGTCEGFYESIENLKGEFVSFNILELNNISNDNSNEIDVIEWFEFSSKRKKQDLKIIGVLSKKPNFSQFFIDLLKEKYNFFQEESSNNLIKRFIKVKNEN